MFYQLALLVNLIGLFVGGCRTVNRGQSFLRDSSATNTNDDANCRDVDFVHRFRDIFYSLASHKGTNYGADSEYFPDAYNKLDITDDEIRQMIYLPTNQAICFGEKVINSLPVTTTTGMQYLDALDVGMQKNSAINKTEPFYKNGVSQPFEVVQNSTRTVFADKGPATIIVIPGFLAEFFQPIPFENLQKAKSSAFRSQFQPAIENLSDVAWRNTMRKNKKIPMSSVMKLSSLDVDGKSLINVIFLPSLEGSLETIGETRNVSKLYLRRLNAFFAEVSRISGDVGNQATKNIYLLGYSRGHLTSMDLAVLARETHASWADRIKGVINMAGVVYGTAIADDILVDKNSATYQTVQKVLKANAKLKDLEDFEMASKDLSSIESAALAVKFRAENLAQEIIAAADFIQAGIPSPNANITSEAQMLRQAAPTSFDIANPVQILTIVQKLRKQTFKADSFLGLSPIEHLQAVSQWKRLVSTLLVGLQTMSKTGRLDWYASHVLPPDLKYFSISGSMPDPYEDNKIGLLENRYYGSRLPDFNLLRGNYYTMIDQTHLAVNDSQVSYPMSRMWPSLATRLNPAQGPLDTYYLGLLGTHHWGIAWNSAITEIGGTGNLFPKTILLESLATFVLQQQDK